VHLETMCYNDVTLRNGVFNDLNLDGDVCFNALLAM